MCLQQKDLKFFSIYQVKHLDMELDSPEVKVKGHPAKGNGDYCFARASSETKDPGVLGPIVWDLKRKRAVEGK